MLLFHSAAVIVITKIDIAEAVEWDREAAYDAIRRINPAAAVVETSARRDIGVQTLLDLLTLARTPTRQLQEAP